MKVRLDSRTSEAYCKGGLLRRCTIKPFSSDKSMSTVRLVIVTLDPKKSMSTVKLVIVTLDPKKSMSTVGLVIATNLCQLWDL